VTDADLDRALAAAVEAAGAAGEVAMRYYRTGFDVTMKADATPVTEADRGAERAIREVIGGAFPAHGFLGEEFGAVGDQTTRWIIDPIDGTRNFIRHVPIWATLIGLEYKGEQIGGVVYIPVFGMTYRALRGDGAYHNERRIRVSDVSKLAECSLCYSSMGWFTRAGKEDVFHALYRQTKRQRGHGDFYGFVLVAEGAADVMVEHGVNPWDVAATKAIIEEAGGSFTDWTGKPTIHTPDVLATNGKLHAPALEILRGAGR